MNSCYCLTHGQDTTALKFISLSWLKWPHSINPSSCLTMNHIIWAHNPTKHLQYLIDSSSLCYITAVSLTVSAKSTNLCMYISRLPMKTVHKQNHLCGFDSREKRRILCPFSNKSVVYWKQCLLPYLTVYQQCWTISCSLHCAQEYSQYKYHCSALRNTCN